MERNIKKEREGQREGSIKNKKYKENDFIFNKGGWNNEKKREGERKEKKRGRKG